MIKSGLLLGMMAFVPLLVRAAPMATPPVVFEVAQAGRPEAAGRERGAARSAPVCDGRAVARFRSDFESDRVEDVGPARAEYRSPRSPMACAGGSDTPVRMGSWAVEYEGGDRSQRRAEVVPDPAGGSNRVLMFELAQPNVSDRRGEPEKGRIQLDVYRNSGVHEARVSVRAFFDPSLRSLFALKSKLDWMTVSEWWSDAPWTGRSYPLRLTVDLAKDEGPSAGLHFRVHTQTFDRTTNKWSADLWEASNRSILVPLGEWVTLDYYWRDGGANSGRFVLGLTRDGGVRQVVVDQVGFTHHPDDPSPDGLANLNPIKLYTSRWAIEQVRRTGQSLKVYWDDLNVTFCGANATTGSACAP